MRGTHLSQAHNSWDICRGATTGSSSKSSTTPKPAPGTPKLPSSTAGPATCSKTRSFPAASSRWCRAHELQPTLNNFPLMLVHRFRSSPVALHHARISNSQLLSDRFDNRPRHVQNVRHPATETGAIAHGTRPNRDRAQRTAILNSSGKSTSSEERLGQAGKAEQCDWIAAAPHS
jgi:hypothetical protein